MSTLQYLVILAILVMPFSSFATELTLKVGKEHTVPEAKIWLIKGVSQPDCDVCTSDLIIDGQVFVGGNYGLTLWGKVEFGFNKIEHAELRVSSGSKLFVGDSRGKLFVQEVDE